MDRILAHLYRRTLDDQFARIWAASMGLAVVTGFLDFVHVYVSYRLGAEAFSWGAIAHGYAVWWSTYIVLVAIALLMARRFQLTPGALTSNLGIHLVAALFLAYTHTICNALRVAPHRGLTVEFLRQVVSWASMNFPIDFVSYWAIVGLSSTYCYYSIARRDEERSRKIALQTRDLIETSLDALVKVSRGGKITDANRATELLTGVRRERLIGTDLSEYFTEPEKVHDGCRQVFSKWSIRDFPLAIRSAAGGVTDVLCNASVAKNEAGEVDGIVATARDMTMYKQLEEEQLQSQKLDALGRFAGGLAHDFNNILGVILGCAELAQKRLPAEDALARQIVTIEKAAERAASLTQQLLAFSRKQVMRPKVLNLNDVVTELSERLSRLIGENLLLIVDLADDLASVEIDPAQMQQVLMCLAENACAAMPQGGSLVIATANVVLDSQYRQKDARLAPGAYVTISVSDSGVGMDEETTAHIFEPYFTTKELGTAKGLGLSIVHGIVGQSGGDILVESELGRGTTFKIFLPESTQQPEAALHQMPAVKVNEPATKTILIVEDEVELALIMREILESSGYSTLLAGSGAEALQLAQNHRGTIHLLLTDVILPNEMDGKELAQRLQQVRPNLSVIYMSGYNNVLVAADGRLGPGAILLEKPFSLVVLLDKVRQVLDSDS